jgi:autotransporter-associated beta strand protein
LRHPASAAARAVVALAVIAFLAPAARAQTDYFWNAPNGGTNSWDLITQDWSTTSAGPVNYTWINSGSERANFGNTAGTVTLGTNITAYGINFTTANYILAGGGNTLTLAGTGGVINTNVAATINSAIGGNVGLTKTGSGTLTQSGNSSYSGTTIASAGTLTMTGNNNIGGTSTLTGATLTFNGNNTFNGSTTVTGGTLTLNGSNTLSGTTAVTGGTLIGTAQASGTPFGAAPFTLNNGILRLNGIASTTSTSAGDLTLLAPSINGTGVSSLVVNNTTGGTGVTTTLAAGNLARSAGTGSALVITPFTGNLGTGTGTGEAVTFANGNSGGNPLLINTGSTSVLPAWIITQGSNAAPVLDFTTYGANGVGVVSYSSTNLNSATSTDVVNQGTGGATNPVSAFALKLAANAQFGLANNQLILGNPGLSGQAGLILNSGAQLTGGNITFNPQEGLIYVQGATVIGTNGAGNGITAAGGLAITAVGAANTTINSSITQTLQAIQVTLTGTTAGTSFTLNGTNNYSGGTLLSVNTGSSGNIFVGTDSAFGTGKVTNILVPGSSSPQIQAMGGTRTLANAFDLNGGLTFTGTNSFVFSGPINIINAATGGTRTLNNTITTASTSVTFGATPGSSTITLGNPVANGGDGVGKGAVFTGSTGSTIVLNDVIQDPAAGGGAASGNVNIGGTGTVSLNALSTYSGGTLLNGAGTIIPITVSSNALPGASFTAGPFGTGPITINNGTNQHLRPTGNQTISNQIIMTTGFAMDTVAGDTTSSLTFAGPITMQGTGRFISNGFGTGQAGGPMILGAASAPSTITLPTATGQTLSIAALWGPIVVNDVIQNAGAVVGNVALNPQANGNGFDQFPITLNGANTYTGNTTLGGNNFTPMGSILLGVSSNALPGASFTSGPFGTGPLIMSNTSSPPNLIPIGTDRTVSNAITVTSGFSAGTASAAQDPTGPHNLTLAGAISLTTNPRVLTNTMISGVALTLGASSAPSTLTLGSTAGETLTIQGTGTTIINDVIQNASGGGTGSLTVQSGGGGAGTVVLNAANSYSGATSVTGGLLQVANTTGSATGSGAVSVTGGGTVGSGGTLGGTGSVAGNVTVSTTTSGTGNGQGGTIAPGTPTTIGTLTVGNILTLNPLGSYAFRYNGQTTSPVAGTDNNTINNPGQLNLSNLSAANRFTVVLSGTPGSTVNTPVTFTAVTFGTISLPVGVTGPDVTSLFAFTGDYYTVNPVTATINGNTLQFTFTPVPEPAHVLLVCGAVAGGLGWWRRRNGEPGASATGGVRA